MKNIINNFEKEQIKKQTAKKNIPNFRAGDTIKVNVKVAEGERSRIQTFEGMCIAKKNAGLNSSFTVRKISYGEGIERIFPFFSNIVDSIEVVRQGDVRRSKLYYLRNRSGKRTRIADKNRGEEKDQYELTKNSEETNTEEIIDKKFTEKNLGKNDNKKKEVEENNNKSEKTEKNQSLKNGDEPEK